VVLEPTQGTSIEVFINKYKNDVSMIDFDPFCGQKLVEKHSKYVLKKFSKFSIFSKFLFG